MTSRMEAYTQCAPRFISKCTQTAYNRKVNKTTSYETQDGTDYGENICEQIASLLFKVSPMVEQALQDNETIDIFADYCDVPEKGDLSLYYITKDDEAFKPVGNVSNLKFGRGKFVQCIAVHPNQDDIIATSLCDSRSPDPYHEVGKMTSTSSVFIWKLGRSSPLYILKAPDDCTVCHFNSQQPNFVAGGCRNGAVVLWNLFKKELQEVNNTSDDDDTCVMQPVLVSSPEHGPKGMVADICWLSPPIQISAKGKMIEPSLLSNQSSQFLSVSGDGQILFWEIRFRELMEGKLPHIAKVKKQTVDFDEDFPYIKWLPLYKVKPKHLFGSGNISFCRAIVPFTDNIHNDFKPTELLCASEEGELVCINWCPNSHSEDEESGDKEISPQDFVQWMKKDHFRACIRLDQSVLLPSLVLSLSDRKFHLWNIGEKSGTMPFFSSPTASSLISDGKWSPTRPGVIFITKVDGTIDIWDFIGHGCNTPHSTIQLVTNRITSIAFTQNTTKDQVMILGDSTATLHLFDVPHHFARPLLSVFS